MKAFQSVCRSLQPCPIPVACFHDNHYLQSTCGCRQPSERSPPSLKYHWQGQHPAGGKALKHCVRFQRCGARKAASLHWRGRRVAQIAPQLQLHGSLSFIMHEVNYKNCRDWTNTVWAKESVIMQIFASSLSLWRDFFSPFWADFLPATVAERN